MEKLLAATVAAHRGWSDATQALAQARAILAAAERDHDYLAHAAAEIARLAPEPGEETRLAESRSTMMKAARLGEDLAGVLEGLSGEAGALALLRQSARRLERLTDADPVFAAAVADLDAAIERSADAEDRLERWLAASPFNATLLEQSELRLFELRGLARKHKVAVDDLAALGADIDARLALIAQGERTVARLEADVARQWQAFGECCAALARARAAAARRLDKAVAAELVPLKLDKAKFRTAVEPLPPAQWSASGGDRVNSKYRPTPGASFGALTRIASGGELSNT